MNIDEHFKQRGSAMVATLFSAMRPWQVFALISEHWRQELDRVASKTVHLKSEEEEARVATNEAWLLSQRLKAIDDEEAAEIKATEAAGGYDEIHAFLADEARRRPLTLGSPKYLHRFAEDDSRCVYCGQVQVHAHPMEACEVLATVAEHFAVKA
jgi:hypothetical protein